MVSQAYETVAAPVENGSKNSWKKRQTNQLWKKDDPTEYGIQRETDIEMNFSFTWI